MMDQASKAPMAASAPAPVVLVVMATYNGSAHVIDQLRSIRQQLGVTVKLLVGDDGSSDDTPSMVARFCRENGLDLSLIEHRPPMRSASQNFFELLRRADLTGISHVAFSDQDDLWDEQHLAAAVAALEADGADCYSCNTIGFWPDGATRLLRKDFRQKRLDHLFESASQGCTYVFRVEVARRFAAFVTEQRAALTQVQYHDWMLYAWAKESGLRWYTDAQHLVRYRQTHANVIGANSGWGAARRRIRMLREGWLRAQSLAVLGALGQADSPIAHRLRRFGAADRLWLTLHAFQCRRRWRDVLVFAVMTATFGI